MILPTNRLLFWVGIVIVPFAAVGAMVPAAMLVGGGLIGLLLLACVADATRGYGRLEGITVHLPDLVRLTKDREATIEVRIQRPNHKTKELRLGVPLPRSIRSRTEDQVVAFVSDNPMSRLFWYCTAQQRGNFRLNECCVEVDICI